MEIEFCGAARQVTGSKHLIRINGKQILLDCGLFQGHRRQAAEQNKTFPFRANEIDALVLSHAHIDHSGAIPLLVKNGFNGPIYCTHATEDLCSVMLRDSAFIQERDAEWIAKKGKDENAEPLYTENDVYKAMSLFRSVNYHQDVRISADISFSFQNAGHILGAAMEAWEVKDRDTGKNIRFGFTGDLGRSGLPILKDPEQLEGLDALITESTYGDRLHDEIEAVEMHLEKEIHEAYQRGGKILIPAFAVERTQEILYILRNLIHRGRIPHIPIFIDSPLATSATEVFKLHPECFDADLCDLLNSGGDPFMDGEGVKFTQSVEESKALNNFPGCAIIVSASGMCEFGRIRHHLFNNLENPKTLVMIIGFMAQHTLGRKLVEHEDPVNIFGEPLANNAETVIYNAFSGHADQRGLLDFSAKAGSDLKNIFCVHGEAKQMDTFVDALRKLPNTKNAQIAGPIPGDIYELTTDGDFQKSHKFNTQSRNLIPIDGEKEGVGES